MKKPFSNSFWISSYKLVSKNCAVNKISCTESSRPSVRKNVFHFKNTVLNPKTVPKAVFDPQIFYKTVFQVSHDFQEKLRKFGL